MEDKKESPKDTPKLVVERAKKNFELARSAFSQTRQLAVEDTQFVMGDSNNTYQWPQDVVTSRKGDRKVMLTINLTAQHCNQIINQIRQQRPACRVLPVDDYGDKKTAEILAGLIRNIQSSSNADDAHDVAAEHAIYGGEGYWRIITEYESSKSDKQVIKIKPINNPQLVYVDPDAIELDKSDAEWGFVFEDVKKSTIEREYPELKDDISNWGIDNKSQWVTEDTVRVAEYYECDFVKENCLFLETGDAMFESELDKGIVRKGMELVNEYTQESIAITSERESFVKKWKWYKLVGGNDTPVDERDLLGEYLPIVSVVGKEVNVNGEIIRKGIVRDLKDSARMVNYAFSEAVHTIALQNKIPYIADAKAIEGYENQWATANSSNEAYLPFNAYDDEGKSLPRPERQQPAIMPAAQIQLLQIATEEMRASSGQQNANFGIKSEASSGVGIQRLKAQGEIATFHFPDNLARALRYEAVLLIDLIQKYYDTKRIVRVLGLDGKQEQAMLDPDHPQSYSEHDIGQEDIAKIFNPTIGLFDVVIDTGPSFQTQRQEAFAALSEMAARNPALMQIAGDLIVRAADFPMADQLANRLQKALPPNLQEQKGGAEQQLAQVSQQAQQMSQQLQMLGQQLQETQAKLQQAESGVQKAQLEMQHKMQMAQFDAQVEELKQQRALEAEFKLEAYRAQLTQQQREAEMHAQLMQAQMEFKAKQQSEGMAMSGEMARSHQEACKEVQITQMNNENAMEIAELNVYADLLKTGMQNQELTADVNKDLQDDNG